MQVPRAASNVFPGLQVLQKSVFVQLAQLPAQATQADAAVAPAVTPVPSVQAVSAPAANQYPSFAVVHKDAVVPVQTLQPVAQPVMAVDPTK